MSQFSEEQWDAFVRDHPLASFFHRSAWRHVASDVFGHPAHYLTEQRNGNITAVLPLMEIRSRLFGHALISTAFCVGGGPLATDTGSFEAILDRAETLGRKLRVDYIELRDLPSATRGWTARDNLYAGFERPIAPAEDDNLKQIPRKQRAVVRKALAQGLTVSIETSTQAFYGLYARTMRDHGTPALPRRYFERVLSAFGSDCEILTVSSGGRPLSSVLSYFFRDRVMPYYTGSRPEARGCGANDLMYWAVMRRAVERGCEAFDFGRSKVGTGPYDFKRNWGFEPRPITHQYRLLNSKALPNLNPTNQRYAALIGAWRRLPLGVANGLSPLLSRSLG
ncbi:FemAB family XrtA/PEP-CTERM system-associated protein [Phenylobacterium sp.]|uniref:FemAB family XrtA/PEP-CTERM system-associated protein n=1 Tax=Phenylobacterium sp. TaxID=1871053 RepID=UPI002E31E3C7|nr:FemAB family XrtA/PEP-CTERM system-associated protein [Phenylobacterium sp.]HEX4710784.1 FemAB family XrtA/PEP-CTERM system-associated protein [Phenylobacterium sp.]